MNGFHALMYHEIIDREGYNREQYKGIKVQQAYHDILPEDLFCFKDEFEKQMAYLYDSGYTTLTTEQVIDFYYNNKSIPDKSVLLTFDDAYKSVLLNAYPILKKYNFHSVCFVVLGWLFDEAQEYRKDYSVCMSKAELLSMKDVFEYGNHTNLLHTRKGMKSDFQTEDKDIILADLSTCEAFVSTKKIFAYPFGLYTKENMDWLKEFGTLVAFTSSAGFNTKETNPLELHRNACRLQYSIDDFITMIEV
ncbi:MAG: polysaccharide deacetylase family protein [Clostridiales bacterium]|jgi:peptidoglycan/xylan/chitin deacetylase (PgdA/CDA1 family)|nr:polysaccharide deacetylase family protein [Clostridiales bacterium]